MLNNRKVIEIRRAGFVNKGAHLMLLAVLEKLHKTNPNAALAMAPTRSTYEAPYESRASLSLFQKPHISIKGFSLQPFVDLIPQTARDMLGIVLDKEVDVVLDAAGFAYGDQFGTRSVNELAASCKKWKKNGTKVILMPQAMGPFRSKQSKKAMSVVVGNCDMIFVRDSISLAYLEELVGQQPNVKLAPDFTNLVTATAVDTARFAGKVAIIPNAKMLTATNDAEASRYHHFLQYTIKLISDLGATPFLLVHERDDEALAIEVQSHVPIDLEVVWESDPKKIKGILNVVSMVISSRFHGLVSALSQATPCLATTWSHKYEMLMNDYGCSELVTSVNISDIEIEKTVKLFFDKAHDVYFQKKLLEASIRQKELAEGMWEQILEVIEADD